MIFGKSRLELKVGIFVFIGLLIMIIFVLLISDIQTLVSGYNINFKFNFINGIRVGAPVRFAGVDIGEVKRIRIVFNPQEQNTEVEISGLISKGVSIPIDSVVWVNTLGLLGEKYIEIMPGKNYNEFIGPNGTLIGNDPLATQEVTEIAKRIADDLDQLIAKIKNKEGTIGKLLYDDAIYREIETAIKNREGTIGKLFYDDSLYKEVESLIIDIKNHPWKLFWKTKEKTKQKR